MTESYLHSHFCTFAFVSILLLMTERQIDWQIHRSEADRLVKCLNISSAPITTPYHSLKIFQGSYIFSNSTCALVFLFSWGGPTCSEFYDLFLLIRYLYVMFSLYKFSSLWCISSALCKYKITFLRMRVSNLFFVSLTLFTRC